MTKYTYTYPNIPLVLEKGRQTFCLSLFLKTTPFQQP